MSAPAVVVDGLMRDYGAHRVLDDVSLSIEPGEIIGILGPNGAGKTTLVECLSGLRKPSGGTVRVLGLDPARERAALTRVLSVQPQSASLIDTLSVGETLALFASFHADPREPAEVLALLGLTAQSGTRVRVLSGGQLRRLLIAIALLPRPRVIVLDEPTAGVDPLARHEIWDVVRVLAAAGTTVILTSHQMEEVTALCDRIGVMVGGRLAAFGATADILRAHGGQGWVEFTVPEGTDLASLADSDMRVLPGAPAGRIRVRLSTHDPDETLRRITFRRALGARDLTTGRGDLEDVLRELTTRSAGDAREPS